VSNPVVLITGGLSGIGRAAAVAFAKKGAKVVVAGRRDDAGKTLVKELRSLGSEAEFINADVRKDEDVRALVDKTVARFGRLDVAVNNAGTEGQVGPITDQTSESYAATFDTNVLGVILSMKHEVRVMQGQGSGSIINISSTYGHEGAAGAELLLIGKPKKNRGQIGGSDSNYFLIGVNFCCSGAPRKCAKERSCPRISPISQRGSCRLRRPAEPIGTRPRFCRPTMQ
jgi:NAD(P)-dependent dehydrogenase (short-subunit alcohol dehydrogenase family)